MRAHTAQNPRYETPARDPRSGAVRRRATYRSHASAFTRVWNLKSIAIVFYFCLLLIFGRYITALHYEPLEQWAFDLVRAMRQTMISGLLLLLAIALTEAFAAAKGLSPRRALALGVLASAIAAVVERAGSACRRRIPDRRTAQRKPRLLCFDVYFVDGDWRAWDIGFLVRFARTGRHAADSPMPNAASRRCRRRCAKRS